MPLTNPPSDAQLVRVGSVEFELPETLLAKPEAVANGLVGFRFQGDAKQVVVSLPRNNVEVLRAFHRELSDAGLSDQYFQSVPRLHAAIYEASSADFRWSMSYDELRWHAWLIAKSRVIRSFKTRSVETRFADDVEGLLLVGTRSAVFEWYSKDARAFGTVIFEQKEGDLDLGWVRHACASLRFSGEVYSDDISVEAVAEFLEISDRDEE